MSNLTVIPYKKEDIDILLNKNIKSIIIGVKDLSIYPFELDIESIIDIAGSTDKEIIIALNRMIHNKSIPLIEDVLNKIKNSKIKKILFYDLGILNICKKKNIDKELILSHEHLNASLNSNNFYYNKGIRGSYITSDITYKEILDIKENTNMNIYYTVYGYLPIFYSRRYLISNYFKYINKDNNSDIYYIFNNDLKYMIKEHSYGTIIYSPLVNLINEIDKINNIDNLVIDLSFIEDISIIDKFINKDKEDNTYIGFFDKETIYKLKEDNN